MGGGGAYFFQHGAALAQHSISNAHCRRVGGGKPQPTTPRNNAWKCSAPLLRGDFTAATKQPN